MSAAGMEAPGFLLDEHVPLIIQTRLEQSQAGMRVYAIGGEDAPSKGTLDPEVLARVEARNCLLVTNNRSTMPMHLAARLAQGGHVPGIIQLPKQMAIGVIVSSLLPIWGAGSADDFQDRVTYLPL